MEKANNLFKLSIPAHGKRNYNFKNTRRSAGARHQSSGKKAACRPITKTDRLSQRQSHPSKEAPPDEVITLYHKTPGPNLTDY